jgi:outer membrane receptor protein involved in Fe transport
MSPSPFRLLRILVLCLCAPLAPEAEAGQDSAFRGQVVDRSTGAPVEGATVMVTGLPGTARTRADGRFQLEPRPVPPFQVVVVLANGTVAHPVDVTTFDGAETRIAIDPLASESLTVVGAAPSVTVAPGAATTMLSAEQIRRRSPEHLVQALEMVPGINQVSEGHAAVPAIRGLARGRTLLLIDGGRVSSERRVGPSATFADPASFEGIDVARGPGSVAYGSDAIGGVISVRTRRAEPGSGFHVRGSGTFGGGVPDRRAAIEISQGLAAGGVLFQAHARETDDWDSPVDDSAIFNSGWKDRGVLARFDHQAGPGVFSAGWQSDFGRDVERPRNNSRTVRFYYPHEDSHRFTTSYEVNDHVGFQNLTVTGFLGTSDQRTDQDRFATATTGRSIERADVAAKDFHVKGSGVKFVGPARAEFGIDVNGRFGLEAHDIAIRYDTAGAIISQSDNLSVEAAHRVDTGAYAQVEGAVVPTVRLSGGVRVDRVSTTNEGGYFGDRSTAHGAASGFAAVTVGPFAGVSVTAQAARGFRDPTLSDRYFRGPSGRGFITGNPDLEPEKTRQFDLGARYALGRVQLGAYAYHYRINDLVERYQTETDFFYFRNRGRARLRGFEVEARADLGHGFALETTGQIGRGMALDDSANLDDVSADMIAVLGRKDFGSGRFVQVRAAWIADDRRPGPSEIVAPGATVVDAAAGWSLTRYLDLRFSARNLLDDEYYASPDARWVYAAGRSASLTLDFRY